MWIIVYRVIIIIRVGGGSGRGNREHKMNRADLSSRQTVIMAIFLTSLALIVGNLLIIAAHNPAGAPRFNIIIATVIFYISVLSTFPFGLWTGLGWSGPHPVAYILMGLSIGLFMGLSIGLLNMVVSLAAQALIYGPGMFGEGVNYQGVLVKYEAAAWINHFAGSFLLPTFLFPTGALIGDYMEG